MTASCRAPWQCRLDCSPRGPCPERLPCQSYWQWSQMTGQCWSSLCCHRCPRQACPPALQRCSLSAAAAAAAAAVLCRYSKHHHVCLSTSVQPQSCRCRKSSIRATCDISTPTCHSVGHTASSRASAIRSKCCTHAAAAIHRRSLHIQQAHALFRKVQ